MRLTCSQSPAKMYRSDERLTLAAPMPGLDPEDVKVEVAQDEIVLHGDLRGTLKGGKEAVMDEWTPGPYHREVRLPEGVDGEMANLTCNNGVLVRVMPRAQQTKPATLRLDQVSATHGERIGDAGRPVRKAS